MIWIESLLEYP